MEKSLDVADGLKIILVIELMFLHDNRVIILMQKKTGLSHESFMPSDFFEVR